jgi:hypothetical protein
VPASTPSSWSTGSRRRAAARRAACGCAPRTNSPSPARDPRRAPTPTASRGTRACVVDHPWRIGDFALFAERTGPRIERGIDALWQGEPAGPRRACVSPFGAYDLTGNVDEWTVTSRGEGLRSILKGGYWGTVHARCRSSTRVHGESFYFYQIRFRCCADVPPADDAGADAPPDLSSEDAP